MLLFKPLYQRLVLLLVFSVSFLGLFGCEDEGCHECTERAIVFSFVDTIWNEARQSTDYYRLVTDRGPFYPEDVWIEEYPSGDTAAFSCNFCDNFCQYGLYENLYKKIYGMEDRTFFVHFKDDIDTMIVPTKGDITLNGIPMLPGNHTFLLKPL